MLSIIKYATLLLYINLNARWCISTAMYFRIQYNSLSALFTNSSIIRLLHRLIHWTCFTVECLMLSSHVLMFTGCLLSLQRFVGILSRRWRTLEDGQVARMRWVGVNYRLLVTLFYTKENFKAITLCMFKLNKSLIE